MILDSTTKVIRAVLAGAVTANELEWNVSWADHDPGAKTFTPDHDMGLTTGATAVEIIGSPADGVQRQTKIISIYNADTAAATVTVDIYDGTDSRRWIRAVLNPNWMLGWEYGGTWHVYGDDGIIVSTMSVGVITVEEEDGAPSYDDITTIRFDQADGFVVSQPSAGVARIDSSGTPAPDEEARLLAFWKFFNRGV